METASGGWWFVVNLPVSIAALLGFTIGSQILDLTRTTTAARAMLRGVVVASCSYLGLVVLNICLAIVFSAHQPRGGQSLGSAVWWILFVYGVGAIFVGWLILIAGGWAGFLLHSASRSETLRGPIMKAHRVSRQAVYWLTGLVAFVLVLANSVILWVLFK